MTIQFLLGTVFGIVLTVLVEIALVCYIGGELNKADGRSRQKNGK